MQNRKELAEAGRRKLEEFRKSKAQGKAVTTVPASKPSQDAAAPSPAISKGAAPPPLPLANGYSNGYAGPAPAAVGPSPSPHPPVPAPSPHAFATSTVPPPPAPPPTAPPLQHHLSTPLWKPATQPAPAPPSSSWTPSPPAPAAPVTSFVVLQDAPIPFGAAPAAPPPRASASGLPRVSSTGALLQPWAASIAAAAAPAPSPATAAAAPPEPSAAPISAASEPTPWSTQGAVQQPGSDMAAAAIAGSSSTPGAPAWPWDGPSAAQQPTQISALGGDGPAAAVGGVGLSDDGVAYFSGGAAVDSGDDNYDVPDCPPSSLLSSLFAASAAAPALVQAASSSTPFTGPTHAVGRGGAQSFPPVGSSGSGSAAAPQQQLALPFSDSNGLDHRQGLALQPDGASVQSQPQAHGPPGGSSFPENAALVAVPAPVATGVAAAASSSASAAPLLETEHMGSSGPGPQTAEPSRLGSESREEPMTGAVGKAQPPAAASVVAGGAGYGEAAEASQLAEASRTPGLSYSAVGAQVAPAVAPVVAPSASTGASELVGAVSPGLAAMVGPEPSSSTAKEDMASAAVAPPGDASLRPADGRAAAGTEAAAAASTSTTGDEATAPGNSSYYCYDQLSNSYLAVANAAEHASAGVGAGALGGLPVLPPPPPPPSGSREGLPQRPGTVDTDVTAATVAATASQASGLAAPLLSGSAPMIAGAAAEQPQLHPPSSSSFGAAYSGAPLAPPPQQQQQPRAVPAASRFTSWLFGTPSPAKRPEDRELSASAAAQAPPSPPQASRWAPAPPPIAQSWETASLAVQPASPAPVPAPQPPPSSPPIPPLQLGDSQAPCQTAAEPQDGGLPSSIPLAPLASATDAAAEASSRGTAGGPDVERDPPPPSSYAFASSASAAAGPPPLPELPPLAPQPHSGGAEGAADAASGIAHAYGHSMLGSNVYGSGSSADLVTPWTVGRDVWHGLQPQPLPSFLRSVLDAAPGPGTAAPEQGERALASAMAAAVPLPSAEASVSELPQSRYAERFRDVAPAAAGSLTEPGFFTTAPSFSTSLLPPPPGPPGPSPSAPAGLPAPPPPPYSGLRTPLVAAPADYPAATAATAAATSSTIPHFATAATYLSAYASSAPTATGVAAAAHAHTAAAATTSTSSFLESYLDNLLSTMSAPPKDSAEERAHGHSHTHDGDRPASANGAASASRGTGTPRQSGVGDVSVVERGPETGGGLTDWREDVAQPDGGMGDRDIEAAGGRGGGAGGPSGVLEGAGGSGREEAHPHADGSAALRSRTSRRVSTDSAGVLSVHYHAPGTTHGAGLGGPGGGGSGVSRAQFAALQQHIDELTEEKLALARGLQQQTRINEQLAEENEELMRQFNARGAAMEELQRKMKQYEQELEAQALSLEGFSEERHAARSSYAEASSRAQALAAEVVGLEAQVLQLKSGVLKAERAAEEAQQRARKLAKQVETLTREAQDRAQELQQTQLKGRNLVVKLKQTETKLQAAEEKLAQQQQAALAGLAGPHAARVNMPNGHPPPPPPPPPKPTTEQEVQCDLAAELASEAAEAAAAAAAVESAAADETSSQSAMAVVRHSVSNITDDGGTRLDEAQEEHLVRVDWDAARPQRDAPSAVVAERALASLDDRVLRAAARGAGTLPEGLADVALQLARWLPAGPVSGGDPVAVMVEEELRLVQSIHDLLGSFEEAQETTASRVAELQERLASLTHENDELRHKLELQTQRLELQMQQGVAIAGPPMSLHQTPLADTGIVLTAARPAMTPQSTASQIYQPAQPFLHAAPEPESLMVTPTRSTRATPLPSMDSSAAAAAAPAKQTWMGYLFRPRQKKRTRSSLL